MTDARALPSPPAPCGSNAAIGPKFSSSSSKFSHGGARANSGGPRENSGGPRENSGGPRENSGGPRENSGGFRPDAGRPHKQVVILTATEPATHWCVYQTHPQAERLAARELTRAGYRSYCPLIAAQRWDPVIRSMRHRVLIPRFPGYGFVELGAGDPWMPVKDTAGIARVLLTDGHPATLMAAEIEKHMADDEKLCDLTPETLPSFEPGTEVRILEGAFAGFRGKVLECDGLATRIEVEMFGRLVPTGLARRMVEAA